jgi:hypothetical protein
MLAEQALSLIYTPSFAVFHEQSRLAAAAAALAALLARVAPYLSHLAL